MIFLNTRLPLLAEYKILLMPLRTLVKVGNITNLSDARYCAGMGVEMLGFNAIEGQENYISPKSFQEIRGWLSGPLIVAEIYGVTKEALPAILENYRPDLVEFGSNELAALSHDIPAKLILSIDKKHFEKNRNAIYLWKDKIEYIIINLKNSAEDFINEMADNFPVLLVMDENENILSVLNDSKIKGITLHGSQEIKPGLKNYDHLASILEQLEID